jgi:hypothetical protein
LKFTYPYKSSALNREHPELDIFSLFSILSFLWVIFAVLDPDPDPADQINADPDPQHCSKLTKASSETTPESKVEYEEFFS